MYISKRRFLKNLSVLTIGQAFIPFSQANTSFQPERKEGNEAHRYAMLVDLRRCIGCQSCTVSCSVENQTPLGEFRTTVRQYEVTNEQNITNNVLLPRLCNHCDNPPCVQVCPVQATYQRKDGIVVIDNKRCIGCAYCVQACPYDARFINSETKTADKCTFCTHRLEAGLLPACVESCVGGARIIGDLRDPTSTISKMVDEFKDDLKVLKPDHGTIPHVFYLGLDDAFVNEVNGQPMLWQDKEKAE
ncbi:tetrathionate reductase subunit TtrB [Histophilus somni]|uniref:tetrathionate reductase subunit TtrB n=1 Tax=Histophilus somni TaxID=731 RepID=UPI000165F9CD|nr:tetrathionate reductase subunit TtrB [Histophilus somni]ACA31115.1 4Fe-4S ferredoxin iron-sulfur binding domain protein [Histophilus somni 2336]QEH17944.1 tetrathionate reductase subunit TtrB [Histophilus somni]QQF85179.1 tetrathionate reductase subunit TtrB [Histophilus somni]QQJ91002.1 tetrathionate reductase subunit TtrB [Histophilus somni]THA22401.1 tetrathionate reductase subunit TtrB [Histophilus somni]